MSKDVQVVMQTNRGNIRLNLFGEKIPMTSAQFINLARRGFYDDLAFHRVIPEFMVQGGCPDGNGTGGPGYQFDDEFSRELWHDKPGILSMANAGPGTNGSQFFITHVPTPWLDGKHTVFGEVVSDEDQDVVNAIEQGDVLQAIIIEGDVVELLEQEQEKVDEWNRILDETFPDLAKA